jgi:hypothetical protein
MNFDKFELIVKIHRLFGLMYYAYYPTEKKCKYIFFSLNQLIIFAIILCLSSPCLLIDFNCSDTKRTQHWLGFRQLIIFLIVRNSIAIISSIIYSIKGSVFRQIIEDFRKLFNGLNKNQIKKSNAINLVLILTIFQIIVITIAYVFTFQGGIEIPFFKVIILLISEAYLNILYFSTDFYVVYFITYLVLLQKLFIKELRDYRNVSLTVNDMKTIKSKLYSIQSMIDRISNLVSPLLLFVCGAIFNDLLSCLYFAMKTNANLFLAITSYSGLIGFSIRLIIICFSAERLTTKVCYIRSKFFLTYNCIQIKSKSFLFSVSRITRFFKKWIL